MKLHPNVIEKLLYLYENYGGHVDNRKLREQLTNLDLTSYEKKTGNNETILVLTEEYTKALTGQNKRK